MIRDPTRRVIERFQEIMADKAKHADLSEVKEDPNVAQVSPNKDIGTMIAEIRPTLLNATEAASALSPSRAMCLSWLLDNMHLLDATNFTC